MDAIQLFERVEAIDGSLIDYKPLNFWICGKCRKVTLNPAWTPGNIADKKNTRESAEACCQPAKCHDCQCSLHPQDGYSTSSVRIHSLGIEVCDECFDKRNRAQREQMRLDSIQKTQQRFANAQELSPEHYSGPLYDDLNQQGREGWFDDYANLLEVLGEADSDCWPEWVFCATVTTRQFDLKDAVDHVFENINEDGYEDMNVEPTPELLAAIEKFNRESVPELSVWNVDYTRKVRVPKPPLSCPECAMRHNPPDVLVVETPDGTVKCSECAITASAARCIDSI